MNSNWQYFGANFKQNKHYFLIVNCLKVKKTFFLIVTCLKANQTLFLDRHLFKNKTNIVSLIVTCLKAKQTFSLDRHLFSTVTCTWPANQKRARTLDAANSRWTFQRRSLSVVLFTAEALTYTYIINIDVVNSL